MTGHSLFVSIHFMASENKVSPYTQAYFIVREVSLLRDSPWMS